MRGKLRVRRLTLAPASQPVLANDGEISDAQRILDQERMERSRELVIAASSRDRPHIHAVEEWRRSRFWATSDSDESSQEDDGEDQSLDTPEFVGRAHQAGFSTEELLKAGKELEEVPYDELHQNSIAKTIVQAMVSHRAITPWTGRLPKPRKSPPMALEAAMSRAKVIKSPRSAF